MNTTSEHAISTILVGQSGGPTAAINASLAGVVRAAHAQGLRVLGMRNGIQGFLEGKVVDLTDVLELTTSESEASEQAATILARRTFSSSEKRLQAGWVAAALSCRSLLTTQNPQPSPPIYQQIDAQLKNTR